MATRATAYAAAVAPLVVSATMPKMPSTISGVM